MIREYSKRLASELGKGYTFTALSRMRQFYLLSEKIATVSQLLSWSHYVELLSIEDINEIKYYIDITISQNLSVRKLREKNKNHEYERLDENTKIELIENKETIVSDFFCYIKNEYKIKLGKSYNYIDLLLYNIKYNCYVVVELKVTELRKDHIGQIEVYMNYIDKNIKTINQDKNNWDYYMQKR